MLSIWLHSISPLVNQIALINKFQQMGNISSLCKCLITVKAGLVMVSAQISLMPTLINRLESINKKRDRWLLLFCFAFLFVGSNLRVVTCSSEYTEEGFSPLIDDGLQWKITVSKMTLPRRRATLLTRECKSMSIAFTSHFFIGAEMQRPRVFPIRMFWNCKQFSPQSFHYVTTLPWQSIINQWYRRNVININLIIQLITFADQWS